jgi:mRNA-degrading endonuclease RelE of RelBE toxin-antitoxin system
VAVNDFHVEFTPTALRELRGLDGKEQSLIGATISNLATDIRPADSRRLKTRRGYRLDINDNRIIYTIDVNALLIVIVSIRRYVTSPSDEFSTRSR